MTDPTNAVAEFRRMVSQQARQSPVLWEESRHLIELERCSSTLERLRTLGQSADLPAAVHAQLALAFPPGATRVQELASAPLKALTGFPPAKAVRALCVVFRLVTHPAARWPVPAVSSEDIERQLSRTDNPFDLLLHTDVASLLDLGAGDLSFARELVERYAPALQREGRRLILHGIDRLHPQSKLGGPLHPAQDTIRALESRLGPSFSFYGNQDMFALHNLDDHGKLAPRYTIVTCWSPATPTFAYEPARLSRAVIADDLQRTKGAFRLTRIDGEAALEVRHGARALLFPSWKFDIVGPLALLGLLAQRGALGVLGAVDTQVFWELLAQLLEDSRYRPQDQPFTPHNLPDIFGDTYRALEQAPLGQWINLADLSALRKQLPPPEAGGPAFSFRQVRIRRGATFPGVPASSTARKFSAMSEEAPPWFMTLIPA